MLGRGLRSVDGVVEGEDRVAIVVVEGGVGEDVVVANRVLQGVVVRNVVERAGGSNFEFIGRRTEACSDDRSKSMRSHVFGVTEY